MSDYFDRVERQIVRRVEQGMPRSGRLPSAGGYLAVAAAVLVVIVVAGVFLLARGSGSGAVNPSPAAGAGVKVVFRVSRFGQPSSVLERSAEILRQRLHTAIPGARVSVAGGTIVVAAPNAPVGSRSEILALSATGALAFYDWEADVLAPNGRTVASQLPSPSPAVMDISQGNGSAAPGTLGAGCVPLQQALAVARKAGAGKPLHTEYVGRHWIRVPIGYEVLEAAAPGPGSTSDGYFVARVVPWLDSTYVLNARAGTDPGTHAPDVQLGFNPAGRRLFQAVTRSIARRGAAVSSPGQTLNQHFAIVLDNQLISVPFIDYKQYPDGINGNDGADISGNFTTPAARDLAILLRYGRLPVILTATG
jgi:SecD/SecF fusion protein